MKPSGMLTAVSALTLVVLYSACSPQVRVVGDKDKPIPINAEIKIHIYQHAASVVDQLQEGLDESAEEPENAPSSLLERAALRVVQAFSLPCAYAAEPTPASQADSQWRAALASVQAAYKQAMPLLRSGMLGENRDGYVSVINKGAAASPEELRTAAKIAEQLNQARSQFYALDARLNGQSLRQIQDAYAQAYRDSKKVTGIWVERQQNGEWTWGKN
jgi:uncharacterized protein YdbL (DUF1318 family)